MATKKLKLPLSKSHPKLAKEAHNWDPSDYVAGSHAKKEWSCPNGHTFFRVIRYHVKVQSCPICKVSNPESELSLLNPKYKELLSEAFGWSPVGLSAGMNIKKTWKCHQGHIWEATISNRVKGGTKCPYCTRKFVLKGVNDLATEFPQLVFECDGWDPSQYFSSSNQKKAWKCRLGHSWNAVIYERAIEGTGCPYCSNQRLLIGFNDLETKYPDLAREAFGWDPKSIVAGAHKMVNWKCKFGHVWKMRVVNRTRANQGCAVCDNKQIIVGVNDLGSTHPEVAKLADGWDVREFTAGSHVRKEWKCELGHSWRCAIGDLAVRDHLCPYCSNRKLWSGFNDLKTLFPEIAKEASEWDPFKIHSGSHRKLKWKCAEGHQWSAVVTSRVRSKSGCPSCATSGYDPNRDAYIYFLEHLDWEMYQIGITNYPEKRMGQHQSLGWELINLRGPMSGHLAREWERDILLMLKAKGADLSNENIAGKFDGYTEAWSKSTFAVKSIKELMRLTEEFEDK